MTYSCSDEASASWQIVDALEFEKLRLKNIANRQFREISDNLKFKASVDSLVIDVTLLVSQEYLDDNQEQFNSDFSQYVDTITQSAIHPDWAQEQTQQQDQADIDQQKLVSWFQASNDKLFALNQKRNELLLEISDCEQKILALEFRSETNLSDKLPASEPGTLDLGIDINQLNAELALLDRQQRDLYNSSASATDDDKLRELEKQSNKVFSRRLEIIAEISRANELLASNSARIIPKGDPNEIENEIKASLKQTRELYDSTRNKLKQIDLEIADLEYDMQFLGQFIPEDDLKDKAMPLALSSPGTNNISLIMNEPDSEIEHRIEISGIQKLAILLAGCFGWCFGLLISSFGSDSSSQQESESDTEQVLQNKPEISAKQVSEERESSSDLERASIRNKNVALLLEDELEDVEEEPEILPIEDSHDEFDVEELDDEPEEKQEQAESLSQDTDKLSQDSQEDLLVGPELLVDSVDEEDFSSEVDNNDNLTELANLNGFESWWVESYDRIAHKLSDYPSAMSDGIIFSSLEKSGLSPRFIINLSISLALSGSKVLLISASDDMVLERIFADFARLDICDEAGRSAHIAERIYSGPGFMDCLSNDQPFARFASESPLENLKFLHHGTRNNLKIEDNEFNNNGDYAEIDYDTDFDCILVYMPELLAGGISGFETRIEKGPISNILQQFRNIVAVDLIENFFIRKKSLL